YSNVLLAGSPDETELNNCIPVQLVAQTDLRTAVNLADNPGNLGRKVKIQGTLIAYFGQTGVKTPTAWEFLSEGNDKPVTPPVGGDEGTQANPYTVEQFIAAGVTNKDVWVKGAIVGFLNGNVFMDSLLKFTADGAKATNVLLAPEAGVTDPAKCIVVTLPSGDVRKAVNLRDNPGNLGKTVSLCGTSANVFGATGLSSASDFKF
ncbi:MAG: hypothetical protein K2M97_08740, partial [Muribaculaceae bacterium]|nr:hypothetical protein [Muribaculaceae bacterium]